MSHSMSETATPKKVHDCRGVSLTWLNGITSTDAPWSRKCLKLLSVLQTVTIRIHQNLRLRASPQSTFTS